MVRVFSIGGMTGGFLMISPGLRGQVVQGYSVLTSTLDDWSPWSYIAIGSVFFVLLTIELYNNALPKTKRTPPC